MVLFERVALITGAARRVGRAIALRLAEAGCAVAVHYRSLAQDAADTVASCRLAGVTAEAFQADLAEDGAPASLVRQIEARFGRLDIIVNNASVFEPMSLDDFDPIRWEQTLRLNLTAPLLLVHAARASLQKARGRVVNLCDVATQHPWPEHLAYIVSKGALETLTRVLARALAPDVNVIGVAPGVAAWPDHYDQALRDRLTQSIPLARAGSPDDIAAAVHFLLREGDYITGTIVTVDGGRSLA